MLAKFIDEQYNFLLLNISRNVCFKWFYKLISIFYAVRVWYWRVWFINALV